jgi:heme/copper-type cytochrome/quinol oxidase subunit 2
MNAKFPQPVHESYMKHRKDRAWKIIFPVVFSVVLCIALIVLVNVATFRDNGDVARWAAVSTIWIIIPIMIGMLIFTALLGGLVYLMYKLLDVAPTYTGMAQDYVHKAALYIKRGADAVVRPIINLNGILASISAFFERMKP